MAVSTLSFSEESVSRIRTHVRSDQTRLRAYASLLLSYNRKINLISRQTAERDRIFDHHVLHSLAINAFPFPDGATVVDWGAGGGLPSIPLAITQPDVNFVAVDKVEKKARAVTSMASRLELPNLSAWNGDAAQYPDSIDYSVSRATAPLATLWSWHERSVKEPSDQCEPRWTPGLICLKGGDLESEFEEMQKLSPTAHIDVYDLATALDRAYYDSKVLIHVYL